MSLHRKRFTTVMFAIVLLAGSFVTSARVQPTVVVRFDGRERVSSSDATAVNSSSPFLGSFSDDAAAPVVEQEGTRTSPFDTGGSLQFEFDGVSLRSVGDIAQSTRRVPVIGPSTLSVSSEWVAADGSTQKVETMFLHFLASGGLFAGPGQPTHIESSRAGGCVRMNALELSATDDLSPRGGSFSGTLSSNMTATRGVADDGRMEWLNPIAAIVRVFPTMLFAGGSAAEQAVARSRVALSIDQSALAIAKCDHDAARDTLIELAESMADPVNPQVVAFDFAIALLEPRFSISLSLESACHG